METTPDTDALDRADMARLCAGEDLALNRLMDRHAAALLRFLGRMIGSPEDARDLAQETFARVYRHRERFRASARFMPWLFTIAANLARNHLRWKARHPGISMEAESAGGTTTLGATLAAPGRSPLDATADADRLRSVRAAVDALTPNLRDALALCAWEDLSVAEAARVLKTSPKAVETLLYRARQILRQRLAAWL